LFLHNRRVHAPDLESYELLLVDPEAQAAAALREQFVRSRRPAPRWLAGLGASGTEEARGVDAVIFDLHAGRDGQLDECLRLRREQPALPLIALAAPGPALRRVQAWNDEHRALDDILPHPMVPETLFRAL
jgi:CheY-like chemotaxis protein